MKNLLRALALVLTMPTCLPRFAAAAAPEKAADVAVASVAGEYSGEWRQSPEEFGELRLKLKHDGKAWSAEVSFTYQAATIPTKMRAIEVDGSSIRLTFDWVIDAAKGQSTIKGELKGDTLAGTFESTGDGNETKGTWKVVRGAKPAVPARVN